MELKEIDQKVLSSIRTYQLFRPGDRVLVALSGGPDSVMLLHWLWRHQSSLKIRLFAAHLNHQLRGREADLDQAYVEELCAHLGVPCHGEKRDVARYAEQHHLSKQVAARRLRYALFEEAARSWECQKVAVAHHADDQLETVLMRFIRGTGLAGLSGMRAKRRLTEFRTHPDCQLVRPLLSLTKEEIHFYNAAQQLKPRLDSSNLQDEGTRNWIRHHLVPKMKELNPNLPLVVKEMAELVAADEAYLTQLAQKELKQLIKRQDEVQVQLDLDRLNRLPLPLQRRVILLLLRYLSPDADWGKTHVDTVLHLAEGEKGYRQGDLNAEILVKRQYRWLLFTRRRAKERESPVPFSYELHGPGRWDWPEHGFSLVIEKRIRGRDQEPVPTSSISESKGACQALIKKAYFDADQVRLPFLVRSRQAGDKLVPLGMKGHQKVKDIFIDGKVPLTLRQMWPLIADQEGLLWIPGLKRADRAKVGAHSKQLYVLTMIMGRMFRARGY